MVKDSVTEDLILNSKGGLDYVQLHKHFTSDQVKELLERYLRDEFERKHLQEILGIKERGFFALVGHYRENPHHFTIQYHRTSPLRISQDLEQNIFKEL